LIPSTGVSVSIHPYPEGVKRIYLTVTNDLSTDQRMHRICGSLVKAGYEVVLVGRKRKQSTPLPILSFSMHRLHCWFDSGPFFYAEYNLRLFFYLLFVRMDAICAIDLDTLLPCYLVSVLRKKKRVLDAHELFTEMKEVASRPRIQKIWKFLERKLLPRFKTGYTVNEPIRDIFEEEYGVRYSVVRNCPLLRELPPKNSNERFIIYQGDVNEGRSFETLIPAFQKVDCELWIFGTGNFLEQAKAMVQQLSLQEKVLFKGKMDPEQLRLITPNALLGLTLFENKGLSNYLSLANRFFDYIHAGIPQLVVDYPVYRSILQEFKVGVLIADLSSDHLAEALNEMINDKEALEFMAQNCLKAREQFNWQKEEKELIAVYQKLFSID
jgi:glycosyltransferase involved in cell wall biosynthesis